MGKVTVVGAVPSGSLYQNHGEENKKEDEAEEAVYPSILLGPLQHRVVEFITSLLRGERESSSLSLSLPHMHSRRCLSSSLSVGEPCVLWGVGLEDVVRVCSTLLP